VRHRASGESESWPEAFSLSEGDEVGEEAIGAGHAFGQLAKPGESGVHEPTLAVSGDEERALPNYQRFQRTLALRSSRCANGLDGHPELLREAPPDMRPQRKR
jgi:hypothetical protein